MLIIDICGCKILFWIVINPSISMISNSGGKKGRDERGGVLDPYKLQMQCLVLLKSGPLLESGQELMGEFGLAF